MRLGGSTGVGLDPKLTSTAATRGASTLERQLVERDEADPARPRLLAQVRAEEAGVDYEVTLESLNQWQLAWRKFKKHRLAIIGLGILGVLITVAIVGPFIMPFEFNSIPKPDKIVPAGRPPSLVHPFGETGGLQRDVLLLVVNGARTSLFVGFSSMAIGVIIGTIVGSVMRETADRARRAARHPRSSPPGP